jgi:uncharacterized protein with NRDE domain
MCTLVISVDPHARHPMVIAANRDEMAGRPWLAPARHWPDRDEVVAGLDQLAGGSWLGMNESGVVAAILNRMGTLGPAPGKRSRGELVLDALDFADAVDAADAFADLSAEAWRPFNMLIADNRDVFWIKSEGAGSVQAHRLDPGVHMLSAYDLDDSRSPRIRAYQSRFQAADRPDPDGQDGWHEWAKLMADTGSSGDGEEDAAMCFTRPSGFGTVSSSLIALPAIGLEQPPHWLFAAGRPDTCAYLSVFPK